MMDIDTLKYLQWCTKKEVSYLGSITCEHQHKHVCLCDKKQFSRYNKKYDQNLNNFVLEDKF